MAIVVVGLGANVSLAQRQARLGAFEGLALALFITAEHQGPIRRIEVEAHHVPKLFLKPKVLGELEIAHPVRAAAYGPTRVAARSICSARFRWPSCARSRVRRAAPGCAPDSRPVLQPWPKARGLRPRPGASLSPSKPLAAHRFLQRPMAKRLTDCSLAISSWESP